MNTSSETTFQKTKKKYFIRSLKPNSENSYISLRMCFFVIVKISPKK